MRIPIRVRRRENLEDPPQRVYLQLVGDFLYGILRISLVAISWGRVVARGAFSFGWGWILVLCSCAGDAPPVECIPVE